MKKLSLLKMLSVTSVICYNQVGYADPGAMLKRATGKLDKEMSSLIKNGIDKANVNAFQQVMNDLTNSLNQQLEKYNGHDPNGRINYMIGYFGGLRVLVQELLDYQNGRPTVPQRTRLEAIAKSYGGKVHKLIWPVIHPAAPPPPSPQPAPDVGGDE